MTEQLNLYIDVGNTNTLFALGRGRDFPHQWRIHSDTERTRDEYAVWFFPLAALADVVLTDISHVVICSVVPKALWNIGRFVERYLGHCTCHVVGKTLRQHAMQILIEAPEQLGQDRLVNAYACRQICAQQHAPNLAAIAIDFGTATTFDVVNAQGHYVGGVIASGVQATADVFVRKTASLPYVEVDSLRAREEGVLGKTTEHAIRSGLIFGYSAMIDGLVSQLRAHRELEHTQPLVIATGGLAQVFAPLCQSFSLVEHDLLLLGLAHLLEQAQLA